jgi:hypothetical protein
MKNVPEKTDGKYFRAKQYKLAEIVATSAETGNDFKSKN